MPWARNLNEQDPDLSFTYYEILTRLSRRRPGVRCGWQQAALREISEALATRIADPEKLIAMGWPPR